MSAGEDGRDAQLQKELADCVMSSSWIFCLRYPLHDRMDHPTYRMH